MIRTILNNEFNKLTGQELTGHEYTALMDYIEYYGMGDWDTTDLRGAVANFIEECYDHDDKTGEYTILDWWKFPMATTIVDGNKVITTYRGCTTTTYREVA